ncbi:MarR family transcriptional regulator [Roseomonas sp. 18066]|uniref:MarR family transcriptional regulator n=1 Tax=Roseomonas sp. 18066 TaxID=2681412 RepID=UPI00135ABCF1|nr:MarR family transcriptional regulator [Roseomonas sp. 18066]
MTVEVQDSATILRAVLSLGRRLRAAQPAGGISLSGMALLGTLSRQGPMPAARLAEAEGLQAQSLTRLIAALERAACIARRRSEADRREIVITLTERGKAALAEDLQARRLWLERAMAEALGAAERGALQQAAGAMLKLATHRSATLAQENSA